MWQLLNEFLFLLNQMWCGWVSNDKECARKNPDIGFWNMCFVDFCTEKSFPIKAKVLWHLSRANIRLFWFEFDGYWKFSKFQIWKWQWLFQHFCTPIALKILPEPIPDPQEAQLALPPQFHWYFVKKFWGTCWRTCISGILGQSIGD